VIDTVVMTCIVRGLYENEREMNAPILRRYMA